MTDPEQDIIDAACDLVDLWEAQKIEGLSRAERNEEINHVRTRLRRAVNMEITDTTTLIRKHIVGSVQAKYSIEHAADTIHRFAEVIASSIRQGGKLMICGNGGSAADAQHIAAEFVVRLKSDNNRAALPALALALDSSTMTACANDYGFENVYRRTLEALASDNDVLLVLSTSGNSRNIENVCLAAAERGVFCLGLLGQTGGVIQHVCDPLIVPNNVTAHIQETHIMIGHIIVDLVERMLEEPL